MQLPNERTGHSPPPDLVERRRAMEAALRAGAWRTERPARVETLGGVRVLRFEPIGPSRMTLLHLHGGGFRIGCAEMAGPFATALAERCGVEVICPDYRLAPEHPFPAGLADARAVLHELVAAGQGPLVLSGDSAGGGLAASLTALCSHEARPVGVVLLSPWLDLTVTSHSYESNAASDPMFSRIAAEQAAELYLQGASPRHPLASPLFAPVTDFPPTLIVVGAEEVLADDGRLFYEQAVAAGGEAHLLCVAGMEHVAVTRSLSLRGATESLEAIANFIERCVPKHSARRAPGDQ